MVAWQSLTRTASPLGIFARRFNSAGAAGRHRVPGERPHHRLSALPKIAADDSGDFVVAWESAGQDGYVEGVFARRFSAADAGRRRVPGQRLHRRRPARPVARLGQRRRLRHRLAHRRRRTATRNGVFAQRFSLPPARHARHRRQRGARPAHRWAARPARPLRLHRHHARPPPPSGANCSRCDGTSITNYLTGLGSMLDIDDNGDARPAHRRAARSPLPLRVHRRRSPTTRWAGNCVTRLRRGGRSCRTSKRSTRGH